MSMTPMERLRELLSERGVIYTGPVRVGEVSTTWIDADGFPVEAIPCGSGLLLKSALTPETVVDVTMGDDTPVYLCPKCGVAYELDFIDKEFGKPNYCPHCGYRRLYV